MLEMLLNPKRAERRPWELFFIGFVYAGISLLFANWLFSNNPVFSKHVSILVITFTVMFSLPFFYFLIKLEEEKNHKKGRGLLKEHGKAIMALMWLFLGYMTAYSLGYILFPSMIGQTFGAQIEQYCTLNMPSQFRECVVKNGGVLAGGFGLDLAGNVTTTEYVLGILVNNIYVLMFSFIFSIIFGAGAIFILAWNASVIATAVGIFAKSSLSNLPTAISRYMIHGLPEIAAYFIAALAGGTLSVAFIRQEMGRPKFWSTLGDSVNLILIAIALLFLGVFVEVVITPILF